MGFGVFIHRSDSIYDDSPAERYQFPSQYLGRAQACLGDWIVYYEPTKVAGTRGYFAVAKVGDVVSDPTAPGMYLALIEPGSYLDFASPVSGLGSKIGLDATDKFPGETNREWGRQIRMEQAVIDKVDAMWSELGLPGSGKKIWR